jgi:hypothetical protein
VSLVDFVYLNAANPAPKQAETATTRVVVSLKAINEA